MTWIATKLDTMKADREALRLELESVRFNARFAEMEIYLLRERIEKLESKPRPRPKYRRESVKVRRNG